ncbi:hypothetical protein FPL06_06725 [Xanthomonas citri pv. glycines]|nr:hypothetical protein BHE84_24620 [Xanthomonas citri pv. glycines str. 8ra]QDR46563.1 hypothetical protein FPK90_19475 [Xanthomonas citri pv. glycines]QDS08555.1 hypothetical protein FPL00_18365 [Xanthomonas citri pv. glycines]QDS12901.1 hypothetical protein FPL03_18725 [Xanthomonas citri pv. glycines]QDS21552.1 hypothetical protein FPL05_19105 [Xanthomonas citri pv. glycines]
MHAYRPGTRREYVHVGSGAASMPLKVPHRYASKHHRLLSAAEDTDALPRWRPFLRTTTLWDCERFYSAATTASPIATVPTLVVPSDQMSAVRRP